MSIRKNIIVTIGVIVVLLSSCGKKTCPAYQSSFLLDEESQIAFFSYFEENEQEDLGTSTTNIHQNPEPGEIDTSASFGRTSGFTPRGDDFPIAKSKKSLFGISDGPTIKSLKKRHYVVPMVDTYVIDSTENIATSDTTIAEIPAADSTLSN